MLWRCDGCGATRECDPLASDDWDGDEVAIGPECDQSMDYVSDAPAPEPRP